MYQGLEFMTFQETVEQGERVEFLDFPDPALPERLEQVVHLFLFQGVLEVV
jgi:hypothetical protein